jgi:hypothetical protein
MKPRRVEAKVLIKEDTFHRSATARSETAELAVVHLLLSARFAYLLYLVLFRAR